MSAWPLPGYNRLGNAGCIVPNSLHVQLYILVHVHVQKIHVHVHVHGIPMYSIVTMGWLACCVCVCMCV